MSFRLTATDFYTYFQPSECGNRIYLKQIGTEEDPPSPYGEVLIRLGERHEGLHLATFPECVDLSRGTLEEREQKTREAVEKRASVIYQAVLKTTYESGGGKFEVLGEPDFLIRHQNGYIIRDSKISRRITDKDHPEILRQLEIYGWLYEQTLGIPLEGLQVHSGPGDIIEVNYDGGIAALSLLKDIASLKTAKAEIYSPVGWSKCGGCPFYGYCWPRAEANRDVALIPGVDQNLAKALWGQGISTIEEFLGHFDEDSLSGFKRPWGKGSRRVGKDAAKILRMAGAISENKEILIQPPSIPEHPNYVMFDLEGLPPHLDELEKIYLWGMQVFGEKPSEFMPAVSGFGEEGDRKGWDDFLYNALAIFDRYGDIPFVHWHHYERVKIDLYSERYGDRDGIAERVKSNLLDLLPIAQRSIALPLPSYSLKVVEKYVGYERTLGEVAGDWAMAKYIEATETEDRKQRDDLMEQILAYNREDLEATWRVLKWLKSRAL
jgi:predicted RecB family nuclease